MGYFIEIPRLKKSHISDECSLKQELTNVLRYSHPDLSEYEQKIQEASEKIFSREKEIFFDICHTIK